MFHFFIRASGSIGIVSLAVVEVADFTVAIRPTIAFAFVVRLPSRARGDVCIHSLNTLYYLHTRLVSRETMSGSGEFTRTHENVRQCEFM